MQVVYAPDTGDIPPRKMLYGVNVVVSRNKLHSPHLYLYSRSIFFRHSLTAYAAWEKPSIGRSLEKQLRNMRLVLNFLVVRIRN